jgi:hypothetical protein
MKGPSTARTTRCAGTAQRPTSNHVRREAEICVLPLRVRNAGDSFGACEHARASRQQLRVRPRSACARHTSSREPTLGITEGIRGCAWLSHSAGNPALSVATAPRYFEHMPTLPVPRGFAGNGAGVAVGDSVRSSQRLSLSMSHSARARPNTDAALVIIPSAARSQGTKPAGRLYRGRVKQEEPSKSRREACLFRSHPDSSSSHPSPNTHQTPLHTANPPQIDTVEIRFQTALLQEIVRYKASAAHLKELVLQGNGIEVLPSCLSLLTNLCFLSVTWNELSALPPALGSLTCLRSLNASFNRLVHIPSEIGKLHMLEQVSAHHPSRAPLNKAVQ